MAQKRTTLPALPNLVELDSASLGPAMSGLTELQRGYVIGVTYYGLNSSEAARAAGYSENMAVHHAHQLAQHEGIRAAILEAGKALLRGEGARSILAMVKIRDDGAVKPDVRLRAAEMIANRSGFHVSTEHHEHVHTHLSETEMDRRILALAAELGMAPEQAKLMLIAPADFQRNSAGIFEMAAEPKPLSDDPRATYQRQVRARRKGMTREEIEADKQRVQAERAEVLRQQLREHEIARGEREPDEFADVEY